MIALPRHLAPWRPHLALFPHDIAIALAPLVMRLAQVIGPGGMAHHREGTPDGYDGIERRGSYDRLLASQWLLHDEVPDEFLRRAVSGEHAFLRRLHRHQAAGRRSVALFDSGIDQFGGPRVAQLAVLIVLAQRASAAGADFAWGILQDRDGRLRTAVTEDGIQALIDSRAERMGEDDVARWLGSDDVTGASETWLVGPEPLAHRMRPPAGGRGSVPQYPPPSGQRRASVLTVTDVLEPASPPRVRVAAFAARGGSARTVTLDLPGGGAAVRLLRNPFDRAVATRLSTPAGVDVRSGMVFSVDGRRLYVNTADGGLLTVVIPNSPRAAPVAPRLFHPPQGRVVAVSAALVNRRPAVVIRQPGGVAVRLLSRRARAVHLLGNWCDVEGPDAAAMTSAGALRPLGFLPVISRVSERLGRYRQAVCLVNDSGQVVVVTPRTGGSCEPIADRVVACLPVHPHNFFYVERSGSTASLKVLDQSRTARTVTADLPLSQSDDTVYRFGPGAAVIAWSAARSQCAVVKGDATMTFDVPHGHGVIGMAAPASAVALDRQRTAIELLEADGSQRRLVTTAEPITSAAASNQTIAFITRSGELGIYSLRSGGTMLLRLAPETSQ